MWTADFWRATAERALKTFAQTLVALLAAGKLDLIHAPWIDSLSAAGMATLLSVLTSVASGAATGGSPSLTNAEVLPEQDAGNYEPKRADHNRSDEGAV